MSLKKSDKLVIDAFSDGASNMEHDYSEYSIVFGTLRFGNTDLAIYNSVPGEKWSLEWISPSETSNILSAERYLKKVTPKNRYKNIWERVRG